MNQSETVLVECVRCNSSHNIQRIALERSKKKNNGFYLCRSCKAKESVCKKPQCNRQFWTSEKCSEHGDAIKMSGKYYAALSVRKTLFGSDNPMFGKQHSSTTKQKMSQSRMGKTGQNATAWKGGKTSLNQRVKGIIHTRYNWYKRVYERDHYCCVECGSKKKIDAHHIKPIWKIIKELLVTDNQFTIEEKIEWLIEQPEIQDVELKNGITLCRDCHKKQHKNWGSHHVG